MLDWIFILLLVIGIILVLLIVFEDFGIFWDTTFILTSILIMFILAISVMDIETPYTLYNATSGNIEEGFHSLQSTTSPFISYFFMMIATIMMIYFVGYILGPAIYKKWMR